MFIVGLGFFYSAIFNSKAGVTFGKSTGLSFPICKRGTEMDNLEIGSHLKCYATMQKSTFPQLWAVNTECRAAHFNVTGPPGEDRQAGRRAM